jgi:regulator of protease activity HflC (stomatin/prohibitin superfamily)
MDWSLILASILGGGLTIFSGFKAYSSIKEGEVGVKLNWGKAARDEHGEIILHYPGVRWLIPYKQKMETLRIKKNIITLTDLTITLKNNLTYKFEAFLFYDTICNPKNVENILFYMEDRDIYVENNFKKAIQKVLHKSEELDIKNASSRLKRELEPILIANGWTIDDVDIVLFAETPTSQLLRGIDYRIEKALEYQDQLNPQILSAALGANAFIPIESHDSEVEIIEEE